MSQVAWSAVSIEWFFGAIKRSGRVATRYEKKAANYLGFAWLAAVLVNLE